MIRPGVPVRRLRLSGNRYTFGSAEGCSIRLNDPSLRPMHAVLIRDANRVLVRAYSVPLEINGNRVTESSLHLGDILRLGSYRFELLSGVDPAAAVDPISPSVLNPTVPGVPPVQQAYPGIDDHLASGVAPTLSAHAMPQHPLNIEAEQRAQRARMKQENAQWRLRQSEYDVRENRLVERETEIRAQEAELWSRMDQVHRREQHLVSQEAAALQIQEEFLARKRELSHLRDETQLQRGLLDERQTQIQSMEAEYRAQIAEASQKLQQSQEQAENATQAVQRMREQFATLNEQLETLTRQQQVLESSDVAQLEENRLIRKQLETARDEAIEARAESEAHRQRAEDRVAELTAQLEQYETGYVSQEAIAESEAVANELRQQIEELQTRVAEATSEATQLREDYEGAKATIRQLELLVDQTTGERDEARSHLDVESDALRQSVEQLTVDLEKANEELQQLRVANETLTKELDEARSDRDEARSEADVRPTTDAWDALRVELAEATARIEQMQRDYDETLTQDAEVTDGNTDSPVLGLVSSFEEAAEPIDQETVAVDDQVDDSIESPFEQVTSEDQDTESALAWDQQDSTEAPEWEDESPEVAVTEAISDIEQSVDAAIGEIESETRQLDSRESTNSSVDSPETESEDGGTEAFQTEYQEAADYQENPDYQETSEHESSEYESLTATEDVSEEGIIDDAVNELQQEDGGTSLADMLIQSMGEDDAEQESSLLVDSESAYDEESPWNYESSDYSSDTETDSEGYNSENYDASSYEGYSDDEDGETLGAEYDQESYSEEYSEYEGDSETAEDSESSYDQHYDYEQDDSVVAESEYDTPSEDEVPQKGAGEDESIEDYMNRLLQRVQGDDEENAVDAAASLQGTMAGADADEIEPEQFDPDAPFVPKSQAPEKSSDLSAMRQLANESARSAVARSAKTQARDIQISAMIQFLFSAVAVGCAALCYFFLANTGPIIQWFGVAMAMVVAIILAQEGIAKLKEASSRMGGTTPVSAPVPDVRDPSE